MKNILQKKKKLILILVIAIPVLFVIYIASYCFVLPIAEKWAPSRSLAYLCYEPVEFMRNHSDFVIKWTEKGYKACGGKVFYGKRYCLSSKRRYRKWHDNGQLQASGQSVNGKPDGILTIYYPNGQIAHKAQIQNGMRIGDQLSYSPGGEISAKKTYKNGKPDGEYFRNFLNGKPNIRGAFDKGKKVGDWAHYYDNGRCKFKGSYKDGLRHGKWSWYYSDGVRFAEGVYEKGKPVDGIFLEEKPPPDLTSLQKIEKLSYSNYFAYLMVDTIVTYKAGKKIKEKIVKLGAYNPKAQVLSEGFYKNGKRWEGTFVDIRNDRGNIKTTIQEYKQGKSTSEKTQIEKKIK